MNRQDKARLGLVVALAIACAAPAAEAATTYGVVYGTGSDASDVITDLDWSAFAKAVSTQEGKNLRLINLRTYTVGGKREWAGVMRAGTGAHHLIAPEAWSDFSKDVATYEGKKLRLESFEIYVDGSTRKYAASMVAGTDDHDAIWDKDFDTLTDEWGKAEKKGLRVVDFRTYIDGGKRLYSIALRAGTGGHAAIVGKTWPDFEKAVKPFDKDGLVLTNLDVYEDGGQRLYAGIYLPGGGHWLFIGDKEGITGATHEWAAIGARPIAITVYDNGCAQSCANTAVMQKNKIDTADSYDYGITMTKEHCPGLPGTCTPKSGDRVFYDWPVDVDGGKRFLRVSALLGQQQIFKLPFDDKQVNHAGTWLYSPGQWHHAIDFLRPDHKTFKVLAAAPGEVIFAGYDSWSGNTVIISHEAGGVKDAYRSIYMHMRDGADHDCNAAWSSAVPALQAGVTGATTAAAKASAQLAVDAFTKFLDKTGCTQKSSTRHLDATFWGTNADTIVGGLVGGKPVKTGAWLGWSGATAPGSCGCMPSASEPKGIVPTAPNTHLHLFTAYRDPSNTQWYFTDPYGIYSTPDCYPAKDTDPINGECEWYESSFDKGRASYP